MPSPRNPASHAARIAAWNLVWRRLLAPDEEAQRANGEKQET